MIWNYLLLSLIIFCWIMLAFLLIKIGEFIGKEVFNNEYDDFGFFIGISAWFSITIGLLFYLESLT